MVIGKKPRVYKRGDISKGIIKDWFKFGKNTKKVEVKGQTPEELNGERYVREENQANPQTFADVRISISPPLEEDFSNQSKNGKSYSVVVEQPKRVSPVVENSGSSGSVCGLRGSLATSSVDVDKALHALPFPTKKVHIAKSWPKCLVDLNNALVHDGSVLYKEEKGPWAVVQLSQFDEAVKDVVLPTKRDAQNAAAMC